MIVKAPIISTCTPERVDVAVETRSAFGDSEFAGDVVLRTVPVWLIGSEGQNIQVNAFLDDGSDSTYVRYDIVTALGLKTEKQTLRLTTSTENCNQEEILAMSMVE